MTPPFREVPEGRDWLRISTLPALNGDTHAQFALEGDTVRKVDDAQNRSVHINTKDYAERCGLLSKNEGERLATAIGESGGRGVRR